MRNNYANTAQLKDLMTVPPMTAARHAELMRERNARRRMLEEARDLKKSEDNRYDDKR
ncbi:hypothetical protein ACFOY5_08395 [Massilia aurea]|jgi:hypothetical protein|uniref:Uncharacterized protein n=1 Tax=Massilia aurea TaxID=373040 RepID=A0A7X0CF26_9BURK|nr:hypothetical protein [Massilia aurea]MBD8544942.1 hypothetical protein [Oxalobacteraceae sp. CFBP 8761]MBD8565537.1 hypothetical protein [Oxalobacteraceae sp. CFBP 8763]MBD8629176.1 hypothetical protein [Oxalobacteraceae sp. CFBP 8753]MBD8633476.1 hypothetical protein [Oxalobacteraceae sp. CFBP 8755]MBD8725299.1 hypothetical protein [Oxalobacteraceae sp. CFBP 13708]